ncbi:type II toxin-antitoxin system RelE/ParE family toxin [Bradyrhizobium diazoefficiens]|uniref:type II toxin-antitoxin system RelE/ParE family toxin n=1 Tax=Bradyrhizobium diazoefficiens TaxID=1355477 RepID=UPI00190D2727|nr:type II toxin-antitoxin system RelE/ParE family toxin [Bradyrhizobium diazoefficiens]MBK3662368.1 type II toxin-antitoxin system RelE/ParE family toxin [Bradyrhizobium diazoefficiens]
MIKSFRNKALGDLWSKGRTAKIDSKMHARILRWLDQLDSAALPEDMNVLGFEFHRLHGKPVRYTVHVNGPWCITFEFENGNAYRVDFEQYH